MKKAIFPLYYFPPISYFKAIIRYSGVLFERHDHYQKQTYRNRCKILNANGVQTLSIPIKKNGIRTSDQKEAFNEIPWQEQHWKSLQIAYRSSPYFEFYEQEFVPLFKAQASNSNLYDFNLLCLEKVLSLLSIQLKWTFTDEYQKVYSNSLDYRNAFSPKAVPSHEMPSYIQVFSDRFEFIPNLSLLDLLFCLGPESLNYLKK